MQEEDSAVSYGEIVVRKYLFQNKVNITKQYVFASLSVCLSHFVPPQSTSYKKW